SQLLRTRPERVLGTATLGGFVLGGTQPADEIIAAQRPAVFWGHGTEDQVIDPAAITHTVGFLPEHSTLTARTYPGLAHGINMDELNDVRSHITAQLDLMPLGKS